MINAGKSTAAGILLSVAIGLLLTADIVSAAGASDAYFAAEACYGRLRDNAARMRLRHNWMRCINQFERAYRQDERGPWAPASLYMTGVLYRELARHSGSLSDSNEAKNRS